MAAQQVIFIHGLWMPGRESHWFRKALAQRYAMEPVLFSYRSRLDTLDGVVEALNRTINGLQAERVHVVAHSLGGLLALRLFDKFPVQPPGRMVLLGTPARGSDAARRLAGARIGRRMLGEIGVQELAAARTRSWQQPRQLGVIAGTRPLGLGRIITRFSEPNDGTVAVRETDIAGATDRIVLPVSHFGMLLSPRVVDQAARFLREGHFSLA